MPALEQAIMDKVRTMPKLPILCLDFDGVLHSYSSGWQGAAIIPDPAVPGAVEFLHGAVERFRVAIYSSRSGQPGGIDAMRGWLTMNVLNVIDDRREAEHVLSLIEWPTEKPAAMVTIDDRAVTFTGTWPSLDEIAAFKPWNKKPTAQGDGTSQEGAITPGHKLVSREMTSGMEDVADKFGDPSDDDWISKVRRLWWALVDAAPALETVRDPAPAKDAGRCDYTECVALGRNVCEDCRGLPPVPADREGGR